MQTFVKPIYCFPFHPHSLVYCPHSHLTLLSVGPRVWFFWPVLAAGSLWSGFHYVHFIQATTNRHILPWNWLPSWHCASRFWSCFTHVSNEAAYTRKDNGPNNSIRTTELSRLKQTKIYRNLIYVQRNLISWISLGFKETISRRCCVIKTQEQGMATKTE